MVGTNRGTKKEFGLKSRFGMKTFRFAKIVAAVIATFACVVPAVAQTPHKSGLPVVRIDTKDNAPILNKVDYVNMTFTLTDSNNPNNNITIVNSIDGIRGRGNDSWDNAVKKSYRIKFDRKNSLFGLESARSWVLIAQYKDPTLLFNVIAFELGDRFELPFNHSFHYVELYLNGEYRGNYLLTEQNQVNPGRVDIDENEGWFVELDGRYEEDPKFITTNYNLPLTVKSPEIEPLHISNPAYNFVIDDINELCDSLASTNFPENGYEKLINMSTFIDFIMITETTDNQDFQWPLSVYLYKNNDAGVNMGPLWDFDCGYGYDYNYNFFNEPNRRTPMHLFFKRFFDDPVFLVKYKERWNEKYSDITSIGGFIDETANRIETSAVENFKIWEDKTYAPNDFSKSISSLKGWYNARVSYLHSELNKVDVLPQNKTFASRTIGYSEVAPQTVTLISYGDMTDLSASLQNADSSDFEISAELNKTPTENGGYLAKISVKPKDSLPAAIYTDVLVLNGSNQGNSFSFNVSLRFIVNKGVIPSGVVFPVFSEAVVYNPERRLSGIALSGSGDGVFVWENGGIVPRVGAGAYNVIFIPNDAVTYVELSRPVELRVKKAIPVVIWPAGVRAMTGQTLDAVSLASFTNRDGPAGVFSWTTPKKSVGEAGIHWHSVTFTPADSASYNVLTKNIAVDVLKGKFIAGPNPVAKQYGILRIYREGRPVANCELRVYNALGNIINTVKINDSATNNNIKRLVGSWNLKDDKGRPVPSGTYVIKGRVNASGGKSERASLILSVW